jgi:DNA-binding protein YbaB
MDNRVLNPDDAHQRLDAWKGRIDKLAADTQAMSDRFQRLQVTKMDPNGMTEVTVDSSGSLVNLRLTREIDRSSPDVIAATIMSTIRSAKTELAERTQEIIEETVGTESPAARAIAERVGEHLRREPGQPDDEQAPQSTAGPRDDEDEADHDLNIWR